MSVDASTPPVPAAPVDLTAGLTTPRGTEYYLLSDLLTDDERKIRDRVRNFVDTQVLPIINDYWERAQFPFELMDLTGIDIGYLTKNDRFAASGDSKDQPSKSVTALVERGELGRKTGRGWYDYDQAGTKTPRPTEQVTPS